MRALGMHRIVGVSEGDGIYMLGGGWRVLDIIELLEQDLEYQSSQYRLASGPSSVVCTSGSPCLATIACSRNARAAPATAVVRHVRRQFSATMERLLP